MRVNVSYRTSICTQMLLDGCLEEHYQIDPKDSWMLAAAEKNLPMVVPGWEDSTLGNIFASNCLQGNLQPSTMKSGIEYMTFLADWYTDFTKDKGLGFFQIGGGIAGDFPICVGTYARARHGTTYPTLELFLPDKR